ncbi:MAG: amino acid adenylation domain-containing protein [Deltaproteobacteria bacterium]|nr:amino acid adenylation domain-containing protein [Deltaproteobacteria bacterium]
MSSSKRKEFVEFTKDEVEQSIPERFEKQVRRYPDRIAGKDSGGVLTYDALNRAANRVARSILKERGETEEPVALLIEHGLAQVVSILGILKSGKIYVPLDPSYPSAMITQILEDAHASLIITSSRNIALAGQLAGNKIGVINIDEIDTTVSAENPDLSMSPDAIANIYYTSGSTGQPKGVMQNHRNVLHFAMLPTNSWPIYADDRIAHFTPCGFSGAPMTIFGALLNGAAVFPFDLKRSGLARLVNWFVEEQISIYFSVPSVFRHFTATLTGERDFPDLRLVVLGGETLYKKDVEDFRKHFSPECVLLNIIASAEMLYLRSYAVSSESEMTQNLVPVGYPVEDKEILLLDDDGNEVGFNEVGEIAVKSRYLSPGYWGRPDLTKDVFFPDPKGGDERIYLSGDMGRMKPDGCLEHLGRKDFQVKIRGQRIEIGEVEQALLQLDNVGETVVVPQEDQRGGKYLVAYVVSKTEPGPTVDGLRAKLMQRLPDFMIPSSFVLLEALPYTQTGKVDRQLLPKPDGQRPQMDRAFVGPDNEMELQIAEICEQVLGVHPIGVTDNLFDLGMDSIRYLHLFLEIEENLGKSLVLDTIPETYTVAHIADFLRQQDHPPAEVFTTDGTPCSSTPPSGQPATLDRSRLARETSPLRRLLVSAISRAKFPYLAGTRFSSWFCGQRWAQAVFFFPQVHLVRRLLKFVSTPMNDADVIQHFLVRNFMRKWRHAAVGRMTSQEFDHWVRVKGVSTFHQSYRKGRGIVLASLHYGPAHLSLLYLNRLGFDEITTLGWTPHILDLLGLGQSRQVMLEVEDSQGSLSMDMALRALRRGGIVNLAADGQDGTSSGIPMPFHGHVRPFKAGFAELAVTTGADVLPVVVSLDISGRVDIEFLTPLDSGSGNMTRQAQVKSLVTWRQVKAFLELPRCHPKGQD